MAENIAEKTGEILGKTVEEMQGLSGWMEGVLTNIGIAEAYAGYLAGAVLFTIVLVLSFLANLVAKEIILVWVSRLVKRTRTKWDDILQENRLFLRFSHVAPIMVIYSFASSFPSAELLIKRVALAYLAVVGMLVIDAFFNSLLEIYQTFEVSREKPIKSYIQVLKIIIFGVGGIFIVAALMGESPWKFLTGLGALSAVLLLIFKDTILGLVASIQLTWNNMVQRGDWIEMPKYGADGDVIDVSLHTIKVQNWDKTVSTIPTYSLITDSFKNWRGMSESGGRRIKRAINIDMNSIKFCTEEMLERFRKFHYITEYLESKQKDVAAFNEEKKVDISEVINGRHLTNVGTFRAYIQAYLRHHPNVHQGMTFLIRHLAPTPHGLPIEIYVFSNDQAWANYEAIQADIFDHIIAALPEFELQVFQNPSGYDFRAFDAAGRG